MAEPFEILVCDANDMEARVQARFKAHPSIGEGASGAIELRGTLRGPFCESSRTLPAEFTFRAIGDSAAEAVVPHPCLWSADLPHVYHVRLEARQRELLIAEYDGQVGLRRMTPRRSGIEFPG